MTWQVWCRLTARQYAHSYRLLDLIGKVPSARLQWRLDRHNQRMERQMKRGVAIMPMFSQRPN
jgi:hypothetical protein